MRPTHNSSFPLSVIFLVNVIDVYESGSRCTLAAAARAAVKTSSKTKEKREARAREREASRYCDEATTKEKRTMTAPAEKN